MISDEKTLYIVLKRRYIHDDNISSIARELNITRRAITSICNEYLQHKQEFIESYRQRNTNDFFKKYARIRKSIKYRVITEQHKKCIESIVNDLCKDRKLQYEKIIRLLNEESVFKSKPISNTTLYKYLKEYYYECFN